MPSLDALVNSTRFASASFPKDYAGESAGNAWLRQTTEEPS
jgi:hypothetical protein